MEDQFARTRLLLGQAAMERLQRSCVALFGVGGVGGHCAEALARSGIGTLHLYDDDRVSPSNLNRQLAALHSTLGQYKAEVLRARVLDINPEICVEARRMFYTPQNADAVELRQYDYVVDAMDTVTAKLELIHRCKSAGVPVISCMGTGNKLDPSALVVTDLSKTSGCPLARIMRKELRRRGIIHLRVVYSTEEPLPYAPDAPLPEEDPVGTDSSRPGVRADRPVPASTPFVPAAAGLLLASAVVRELAGI